MARCLQRQRQLCCTLGAQTSGNGHTVKERRQARVLGADQRGLLLPQELTKRRVTVTHTPSPKGCDGGPAPAPAPPAPTPGPARGHLRVRRPLPDSRLHVGTEATPALGAWVPRDHVAGWRPDLRQEQDKDKAPRLRRDTESTALRLPRHRQAGGLPHTPAAPQDDLAAPDRPAPRPGTKERREGTDPRPPIRPSPPGTWALTDLLPALGPGPQGPRPQGPCPGLRKGAPWGARWTPRLRGQPGRPHSPHALLPSGLRRPRPSPICPPPPSPPPRHMAMLGLGPLRASLRVPLSLPPSPATATPPPQADAPQTTSAWKAQAGLSWAGAAMVGPRSAHAGGGASAEPRPLEGPASWAPCQGPPDLPWAFPAASFQGASGGCLPGTAQKDRASGGSTWVPTPPPSP